MSPRPYVIPNLVRSTSGARRPHRRSSAPEIPGLANCTQQASEPPAPRCTRPYFEKGGNEEPMSGNQSGCPICGRPRCPTCGRPLEVATRGPYLSTAETCEYLRYVGKHRLRSLYRFIEREGIRTARRGRRVLVLKADLERAIGGSSPTIGVN